MSRNLGKTTCEFCDGPVACVGNVHAITREEAHGYFEEYEGMLVAEAACSDCEARYLAWLDETPRRRNARLNTTLYDDSGERLPFDLSFLSTFDDEPGVADYPKYVIVNCRFRYPLAGAPQPAELVRRTDNKQLIALWVQLTK